MSPSALFTRLSQTRKQRPVIDSKSGEDLRTFIEQQLRERETVYSKAQLVVDGINLNILRLSQIIGEYDVLKSSGELHGTYPDPQDHKGRVRD
jgi:RNase adaptor protein for sRNA GlmZ degradation